MSVKPGVVSENFSEFPKEGDKLSTSPCGSLYSTIPLEGFNVVDDYRFPVNVTYF